MLPDAVMVAGNPLELGTAGPQKLIPVPPPAGRVMLSSWKWRGREGLRDVHSKETVTV